MKIKILDDKAIITDNVPLIIDMRGYAAIDVEITDNCTYVFDFKGKSATAKSAVNNGKVQIPECFFAEQTLETVIHRYDGDKMMTLACAPLRLYKLGNANMFSMYVESAIGQQDVRDLAAEAIKGCSDMSLALAELAEEKTRISNELVETKSKLSATAEELASFKQLYNANIDALNDIIRRIEIMEADYDILTT